jgi:acetolactate synthase-1/3 small subunit
MNPSPIQTHTIIAHVEDKPGVLNRIASLFRRRGFNIASLTVGRTARAGVSRLTLMVDADADTARRIEANLYKLVNVLLVEDVTFAPSLTRELALIKVRTGAAARPRVLQLCELFGARIVDLTAELLTIEVTTTPDRIDDLVDVLAVEGVLEMVRTGVVAMTRGEPKEIPTSRPQSCSPHAPSESPESQGTSPWPESSTTATPISA